MSFPSPVCLRGHPMKRDRRIKKADLWRCKECGETIQTEPGFYRDPDYRPRLCGCGCGETVTPSLRHPDQRYVNTAHRMRAFRARRNGGSA